MAYDLKTASEDTTVDGDAFVFGADSQAATNPSVYKVSKIKDYILGLANTWTQNQTFSGGVNKVTITAPATGSTLTIADGKTLTANNTLTLAGTDSTTMTFPSTSGTVATLNTAQTFTQPQTISDSTSRTTSSPVIDAAQTWNASGTTFTGIKLNVTDTLSASGSLLMDLQRSGTSRFSVNSPTGLVTVARSFSAGGDAFAVSVSSGATSVYNTGQFGWTNAGTASGSLDLILTRRGAANLRLGAADAASPVAQTLSVQGRTGTDADASTFPFRITGAQGTGTGVGGPIVFQTSPAGGTSGTAVNSFVDRLSITGSGSVVVGDGANALATTATNGFLYVPTCAGTPTGTPTTQTGTAPIVVDTTNNKLYFYSGGQWRDAGP